MLTFEDRERMRAELRAMRDDRPVSIVIRRGGEELAAQTVRIARIRRGYRFTSGEGREIRSEVVTTFVTTHYMDEAEYCGRLALIYQGRIIALGTPSELKSKTLLQGVLEVECDPLVPALDLLKKESWVSESAVFGDGLHVIGKESVDLEREVNTLFQKHGILLKRMGWIRPSLEDVFVSLIEKEEKQ